jgi:hypothetical protein
MRRSLRRVHDDEPAGRRSRNGGVAHYKGNVYDLYNRAWPRYREPIEKYWIAYLDDRMTLDEAIGRIVEAAPKPR